MKGKVTYSHLMSDQGGLFSRHLATCTVCKPVDRVFMDLCPRQVAGLDQSQGFFFQRGEKLLIISVDLRYKWLGIILCQIQQNNYPHWPLILCTSHFHSGRSLGYITQLRYRTHINVTTCTATSLTGALTT